MNKEAIFFLIIIKHPKLYFYDAIYYIELLIIKQYAIVPLPPHSTETPAKSALSTSFPLVTVSARLQSGTETRDKHFTIHGDI